MRKVILIIATVVVLGGVFALFMWMQGDVPVTGTERSSLAATQPMATTTAGQGEGVWITIPDRNTALTKVRFRADRYTPRGNGQVDAEHPIAEFFLGPKRDRVLRIEGKSGTLFTAGDGPRLRSDLTATPMQPPTRGQMRDVTISYFLSPDDIDQKPPQLTLTLNNAYFDNETYEIATEGYTDSSGRKIDGKDVPIQVRGDNFDFDGKGLYLRWDDRSQRLQSLTIYKSDQLVIKKAFEEAAGTAKPAVAVAQTPSAAAPMPATQKAARQRRTQRTTAKAPNQPVETVYRATFNDGITVTQGKTQLARGQQMMIDFLPPNDEGTSTAEKPTLVPTLVPAPTLAAQPTVAHAQAPPVTPQPAAGPSTRSRRQGESLLAGGEPIILKWNGPMTVVNVPQGAIHPESGDDAVVRLVGSPLLMDSAQGHHIESASAIYQTGRRFALITGSADAPVRMTNPDGSVLLTPELQFDQQQGLATLRGPSSASLIADPEGKRELVQASWTDSAQATFVDMDKSPAVSRLVLQGNVNVQHPRIRQFKAGLLDLDFAAPAGNEPKSEADSRVGALRQITARNKVDAILLNDEDKPVTVRAGNLKLQIGQRADKSVYPSHIEADGSVLAGDEVQQIKADSLRANMDERLGQKGEAKAGLEGLNDLVAIGNVEMRSKDGDRARAQRFELRPDSDGNSWILLEGTPAYVSHGDSSLSGQLIEVNTATDTARVTGGGQMIAAGKANPAAAGGAIGGIELTWSGDARVDGPKDHVSIQGDVGMKYTDDEGVVNEAHGDRLEAVLAKLPERQQVPPALQPKPAPAKAAQTRPAQPEVKEFNFLAGRTVRQVTLFPARDQEIQLQSLKMRGSYIDHQINVFGPRLDCEFSPITTVDKQDSIQLEKLLIPATPNKPSRLLYVSLPPTTRKPVKTSDPFNVGNLPGATAFSWTDRLIFDRSQQQFQMLGAVLIRHQPQADTGRPFDIRAQAITGELDLDPKSKAKASGGLAPAEIKRLLLTGQPVQLGTTDARNQRTVVTNNVMEVHPGTGDVIARGTERNPVTLARGNFTQTFIQVHINTETNDFNGIGGSGTGRQ
jgi:hypothetical protein